MNTIVGKFFRWLLFIPFSLFSIVLILYLLQFAEILLLAFHSVFWLLFWLSMIGILLLSIMQLISGVVASFVVFLCPSRKYGGYIFITFSVIMILLGIISLWTSQEKYDAKVIIVCIAMTFICVALLQSIYGGILLANYREIKSE